MVIKTILLNHFQHITQKAKDINLMLNSLDHQSVRVTWRTMTQSNPVAPEILSA